MSIRAVPMHAELPDLRELRVNSVKPTSAGKAVPVREFW
jgi:hypothetical protein